MDKFGLDNNVIKKLKKIFEKYNEIERACIFGSRAKGIYKNTSDIDIALYGEKLTHTYKEEMATEIYNRIKNTHIHTLEKFINKFDNIM